jgi:hypothetical protein
VSSDVSDLDATGKGTWGFRFNQARQPGEGEDADPILELAAAALCGAVAVFDGMGGAGAARYTFDGETHSGAWFASRLAARVMSELLRNGFPSSAAAAVQFRGDLQSRLVEEFRATGERFDSPATPRLSGTMVRSLPTTLSAVVFAEAEDGLIDYATIWAGDSRAYLLTAGDGLQQISRDDIRSDGDALQNLIDDSPMSNCIDASGEFTLNIHQGRCAPPCAFIAATDGCFNYGPSPAHFEHALLVALSDAASPAEWRDRVLTRQAEVAADDLSLALAAVGWPDIGDARKALRAREAIVAREFITPLDDLDRHVTQVSADHRTALMQRDALRMELWERYRAGYEHFRVGEGDRQT